LQLVLICVFPSKHDTSPPPSFRGGLGSTQDLLESQGEEHGGEHGGGKAELEERGGEGGRQAH